MATKKAPTRKQLIARAKFARMVKARAKEAAAAKRKAGYKLRGGKWVAPKVKQTKKRNPLFGKKFHTVSIKTKRGKLTQRVAGARTKWGARRKLKRAARESGLLNPVTVRKNGRKLYGAAAQAVLAKRGGAKKRGTLLANGKRRNGWLGSQVKRAVTKRLHQPIRLRRKRNGAPADIEAQVQKFLGHPTSEDRMLKITAPAGTPKDVALLGNLVCLKTEDEDFEFDRGEAYLGADGRGNLYVLGDTTPVETNTTFGHIEEIRYEAKKDHINPFRWKRRRSRRNSNVIEYYHYFGEEDGVMPKLKSDGDGLLHISGGNYKIEPEGIVN